jgi:DNA topoisomerase-1
MTWSNITAPHRTLRCPPPRAAASRPAAKKEKAAKPEARKRRAPEDDARRAPKRARGEAGASGSGGNGSELRWTTLEHAGVLFPPAYEPHGVQMLYDGLPVALTPEQEEVATFFAVMKDTDYMSKPTFLRNFWEGFSEVLGPGHVIRSLDKCDFTPIYEWHMAERERKRAAPKEVKDAAKREREAAEAKFKFAVVDGRREQVGNFRIEPPGLFRGRGEHPKMGRIKKRIFPRDVTINIGEGVPVPEHPFAGEAWREVRHDRSVTWLAYWRDPVNVKEYKYVFLAANSAWKSEGDLQKYEKARKLKGEIGGIRATYTRNWEAKERRERQMATALYFIDKLALRAGHEKDDDEADTVGCCTLKCENVEAVPPNLIRFDFLGKDSIRYENEVEVEARVFQNVAAFKAKDGAGRAKAGGDQLFDEFDATDLNQRLKELMEGLSVKVFRTFNASVTLDTLLAERSAEATVDGKKAEYDRANKEVAILCNHQRSESRAHTSQMGKMQEKLAAMQADLAVLVADHKAARAGKACADGRKVSAEVAAARVEKKRAAIVKVEIAVRNKEDLKTVALGTSKINYLDPRITVAWCKRNEVPLEKVFNKSLLSKFLWAMDVEPAFRF